MNYNLEETMTEGTTASDQANKLAVTIAELQRRLEETKVMIRRLEEAQVVSQKTMRLEVSV